MEIEPLSGPFYDRLTPPDEPPATVLCCSYCGEEVIGRRVGEDDAVAACPSCGVIVEGQTVDVPMEIFEAGGDAVLGYLEARRA